MLLWHSSHREMGSMFSALKFGWARDYGGSDAMCLPKLGHKGQYSFCLFRWNIAFGVLSCHVRSLRLPCCQEAQAIWKGHIKVFWLRAPAEVPDNSQHQPPHVSENASNESGPQSSNYSWPLNPPCWGPRYWGAETSPPTVHCRDSWPTESVSTIKWLFYAAVHWHNLLHSNAK